jgi:hypothetical protein
LDQNPPPKLLPHGDMHPSMTETEIAQGGLQSKLKQETRRARACVREGERRNREWEQERDGGEHEHEAT